MPALPEVHRRVTGCPSARRVRRPRGRRCGRLSPCTSGLPPSSTSTVPSVLVRTVPPARPAICCVSWSRWSRSSFAFPPPASVARDPPVEVGDLRGGVVELADLGGGGWHGRWTTGRRRPANRSRGCSRRGTPRRSRRMRHRGRPGARPGRLHDDQKPSSFVARPSSRAPAGRPSSVDSAVARVCAHDDDPVAARNPASRVREPRRAMPSTDTPCPARAAVPRTNRSARRARTTASRAGGCSRRCRRSRCSAR